ncbi:hypothetical protein NFI96_007079, partial [Prochilodus magdalenae]
MQRSNQKPVGQYSVVPSANVCERGVIPLCSSALFAAMLQQIVQFALYSLSETDQIHEQIIMIIKRLNQKVAAGPSASVDIAAGPPASVEVTAGPPTSLDFAAGPPASENYSAPCAAPVSASLSTNQLAYLPASESPVLPVVPKSPVLPVSVCPDMTSADKLMATLGGFRAREIELSTVYISLAEPQSQTRLLARSPASSVTALTHSTGCNSVCYLRPRVEHRFLTLQVKGRTTRRESRDCCVFVFTETWLSDRVPEAAIQLDGLASFRADRDSALCVEFMVVRCRPFYLPREFTTVLIVSVYIPPGATAKAALFLPKFHQHVNFATRGANALDLVYTNIPSAYRAEPCPHLGYSDHISDCFEHTDWQMFREAATYSTTTDLEEYTSSVTSYIGKCIDDVTISKTITTRPNQKPWMTAEVRALLKARDSALKAGDKAALRKARAKLSQGIREAKRAHDALNHFYARCEAQNGVAARKTTPPPDDQVLCLTAADLTDVFADIFNISLSSATVPTCLKATTIIPVPKKSSVSCLNDYRPIALTPIIMKCFERLVMRHIKTLLPPSLDPLQFAYRPNRSGDDAISTTLHLALTHLDNRDTYVRMLFIDFSSAFNTIIPQHLIGKLNLLGLNTSLSNWILDFLTGRPQSVRIGRNTSSTTMLSTGAPQGCVLSPLLFTLLTHDCAAMHSSNHIIKFADDTTVVGLISKNDESAYREEVQRLTDWCRTNNLSLNVDKTKEMVVDLRRTRRDHSPLHIDGSSVEIVKSTKFLGVHLAEDLTWSLNTSTITKKAQQRLYFLRRLRKAHLPPPILTTFYRGTIKSILSSCITAWFENCTASDRKSLQRVVRTAEKIIGVSLLTITDIYTTRCIRKATSIVQTHMHLFDLLPS